MGIPAKLPNFEGTKGPRKNDFIGWVKWCWSHRPIAGRGVRVDVTPGGAVISANTPEAVRIAKAGAGIAAPTWGGTNLVCSSGSITFLKPYASGWTLGSETATAWNVMEGASAVSSGDIVLVAWCDGRWAIIAASC